MLGQVEKERVVVWREGLLQLVESRRWCREIWSARSERFWTIPVGHCLDKSYIRWRTG